MPGSIHGGHDAVELGGFEVFKPSGDIRFPPAKGRLANPNPFRKPILPHPVVKGRSANAADLHDLACSEDAVDGGWSFASGRGKG